jgi:hypothetical protein
VGNPRSHDQALDEVGRVVVSFAVMMSWRQGQPPARVKASPDRSIRGSSRGRSCGYGCPVKPSLNCPSATWWRLRAAIRRGCRRKVGS